MKLTEKIDYYTPGWWGMKKDPEGLWCLRQDMLDILHAIGQDYLQGMKICSDALKVAAQAQRDLKPIPDETWDGITRRLDDQEDSITKRLEQLRIGLDEPRLD